MNLVTAEKVKKLFCIGPDQRIQEHKTLLSLISTQVNNTKALYANRFPIISDPDKMTGLPITTAEQITNILKTTSLDTLFANPHTYCWKTSGYSGVSKTYYYSQKDADLFADIWAAYAWLIGVRSHSSFWNFGSKEPMISGKLLELVKKRFITSREIYTPLKSGMDFVNALKKASKSPGADVIAGPTLAYYLTCRAVQEPSYLYESVERVLKNDLHLPGILAKTLSKILLAGFDEKKLQKSLQQMYLGISYAEPLASYREMIQENYPNISMFDVYASTEVPIIGATLGKNDTSLALLMPALFAELADPLEVYKAKKDPDYGVSTIPWYQWEKGMTGELIISRPGTSLPLFRYATGDLLEVVEPIRSFVPESNIIHPKDFSETVEAPAIRVLARAADAIDFETEEEMGSFMGKKLYTPQIQQVISTLKNIVWWELFRIKKGDKGPGPLIFLIYPEHIPNNISTFEREIREALMYKTKDETDTVKSADSMGLLTIKITHPEAFNEIQTELIHKVDAASSLGQFKPRHIFTLDNQIEFRRKAGSKLINALN